MSIVFVAVPLDFDHAKQFVVVQVALIAQCSIPMEIVIRRPSCVDNGSNETTRFVFQKQTSRTWLRGRKRLEFSFILDHAFTHDALECVMNSSA